MIKLGSTDMAKAYVGSSEVSKMYLGSELVYENTPAVLPYDAEVEYLQSDGNQWFTLPVVPSEATDAFEIEFRRTENTNQQRFCHANGEATFQLYVNSSGYVGYSRNSTWASMINSQHGSVGIVKHVLKIDYKNKQFTYDFRNFTVSSTTKAASGNLVVTGQYNNNAIFKGLIYHVKFWKDNTLAYDLIPVRKNGIGYFYNKVGHELYSNEGSGSWIVGRDKLTNLSEFTLLNYIENNNSTANAPYIDTLISNSLGTIDMQMNIKWNAAPPNTFGNSSSPFYSFDSGKYTNAQDKTGEDISTSEYEVVNLDTYSGTPTYVGPITLFRAFQNARRAQDQSTYVSTGRLKGFKIWVNNILSRDFIPVQHPDGTYGMWDNVSGGFYNSCTAENFLGG